MRQTTRQKHFKQHHKTANTRRKNYFHAAQQELQSPHFPTPGFSTLANMMQKLRPLKAKTP
ncbi:hypothetical protein GCM10007984_10130 [Shewanella putrefaciens]|uniref:hypothetical protein n=1 Tax=Shewanella putrefaciens TaxID=24 RepID=UPI0004691650|nr:hypothetical protein [Shewanella putrefaciens]GGN13857.1 hypothetical protein GCM10007984_10130 [Shewanella putrefaciens]